MSQQSDMSPPPAERRGTAVITGASSGLGKVYADRLARRGYDLILIARRGDELERLAKSLRHSYHVAASVMAVDLSSQIDLERVAAALASNVNITLLVNNAGTSTLAPLVETSKAQLDAMNAVNVSAVARLSQAVLPGFRERDRGTLINIGSVLGFFTLPVSAAYSATKGYVNNFTRALQDEVEGTNVIVQLVMPAATATEIWEISGVSLSNLAPDTVMAAEDCVDAALAGLDQGERLTFPSLEDRELFHAYETARMGLFAGTQSGTAASRYGIAP